jgi:hypothetical protein
MADIQKFKELIFAIEAAGYFTSFRSNVPGGMLVCVSRKDRSGRLCGNSFLVMKRKRTWFLSTWGEHAAYKVPSTESIVPICLDCLASSEHPLADIPGKLVQKYGLVKTPLQAS